MKIQSSPERAFILSCLDSLLHPGKGELTLPANLDWGRFLALLKKDRLSALFYSISRDNPGLFPASVRPELQKARYANLLYGDGARAQIIELLNGLRQAAVPVIVLKGWAYIQWLYQGDHGSRFTEDIDLLVPPTSVDQAEKVLAGLGFQGSLEVEEGYSRAYANARAYSKPGSQVATFRLFSIGLHWGLTHYPRYDPSRIDISDLFARALPLKVAGVEVLELSPEDALIYACAHLALHHRNQEPYLQYYETAAVLQRSERHPDLAVVIQRSQQWKYFLQVRHVLLHLTNLFPGSVSSDTITKFTQVRAPLAQRWEDWLVAATGGHRYRAALLEILFLPGWCAKFRAVRLQLLPPASYLKSRYPAEHSRKTHLHWKRVYQAFWGLFRPGRHP